MQRKDMFDILSELRMNTFVLLSLFFFNQGSGFLPAAIVPWSLGTPKCLLLSPRLRIFARFRGA